MHGPDDHEIERRIENSEEPALAFDLGRPACVRPRGSSGRLAKWRFVGGRIYQPIFPGF
jgi:hypothetical protein